MIWLLISINNASLCTTGKIQKNQQFTPTWVQLSELWQMYVILPTPPHSITFLLLKKLSFTLDDSFPDINSIHVKLLAWGHWNEWASGTTYWIIYVEKLGVPWNHWSQFTEVCGLRPSQTLPHLDAFRAEKHVWPQKHKHPHWCLMWCVLFLNTSKETAGKEKQTNENRQHAHNPV